MRRKVLLLENVHPDAARLLGDAGARVETLPHGLPEAELRKKIAGVEVLGIRSKTRVTSELLDRAPRLAAVGAFCIGTDQIDLKACARRGVAVFNAPFSSTRSVAEFVLGEIIILSRGLAEKNRKLHAGIWDKSAAGSREVRGKTLGIVGYGKIGSQLSVLAESIGMKILFYDVEEKMALGNARRCRGLDVLLKSSDVVTLHVDGRATNRGLISRPEIRRMRRGAVLINASRGFVLDERALAEALRQGRLRAAGIDVYAREPKSGSEPFSSPLKGSERAFLTPHVAGSTEEAQRDIAHFVSERLLGYFSTGATLYSANFPPVQLPMAPRVHRLIHVHENVPGMLAQINKVFAAHRANVLGQYLKASEEIGYLLTDISTRYKKEILSDLAAIPRTIRFSVLY